MKRTNYSSGGAGRGRPAPPPAPKAPLPFNLPSMKREAVIDAATGGIAAAGAKWASPRHGTDAPVPQPAASASSPTAAPPPPAAPAWGGAGVRALQKKESADFPTLRSAPPQPMAAPHGVHAPLQGSPMNLSQSSGKPPTIGEDGDWAEDDDTDLSGPLALPEVSIAPAPPVSHSNIPPQFFVQSQYGPRDLHAMHGRGPPSGRHQPPAAHWAVAIKQQQAEIERSSQRRPAPHAMPDPVALPDIKIVEEQKNLMKAKAESAQEAWRRAEQERLRVQRERAAQKLRALEMKMNTSGSDPANRPAQSASTAWRSGPPPKGGSATDSPGANASPSAAPAITPKVLLRRPPKEPITSQSAVLDGGELLASLRAAQPEPIRDNREGAKGRRRNNRSEGNASEQPRRNQSNRHRDNGRAYDGPMENETREQWLDRRRRKTEARDAVRMVIDICINRAVYGHNRRGRRGGGRRSERTGRDRREATHTEEATADSVSSASNSRKHHDPLNHSRHPHDPQTALPSLSLPSSVNPVNESVLAPTIQSPTHRIGPHQPPGFDKVGRDRPPRRGNHSRHGPRRDQQSVSPQQRSNNVPMHQDDNLRQIPHDRIMDPLNPTRPAVLQVSRPAPWAPKVPKGVFVPPVSSPGTRTVASVVDAVVGGESDVSLSSGKKGHGSSHPRGPSGGSGSGANGDREGRPKKSKKRGGRNERMKRERREMQAAERAVAQAAAVVAQSTAAAEAADATSMASSALPPISDNGRHTVYSSKPMDSAGRGAGVAHLSSEDTSSAWNNRAIPPTSFVEISRAFSNPKGISLVSASFVPSPIIPTSTTSMTSNGPTWSGSATWRTQPNSASKLWSTQATGAAPSATSAQHVSSSTSATMGTMPSGPLVGGLAIETKANVESSSTALNVSGCASDGGTQGEAPKSGQEAKPRRGRSKRGGAGSSNRRRKHGSNPHEPWHADSVSKPKTEVKSPTTLLSLNATSPSDVIGNTASAPAGSDPSVAPNESSGESRRGREPRRGSRSGRRGRQQPREGGEDGHTGGNNGAENRSNNDANLQVIDGGSTEGAAKGPERGGRNGARKGRSGRGRRYARGGHGGRGTRHGDSGPGGTGVGSVGGGGGPSSASAAGVGAENSGARGGGCKPGTPSGAEGGRTSG